MRKVGAKSDRNGDRVPRELIACNEEHTGEDKGDAEEAAEGKGVGGQVHEGEVIENCRAGELACDNGGDEGGSAEFGGERGAAEDDDGAEWSADPIPPGGGAQERD